MEEEDKVASREHIHVPGTIGDTIADVVTARLGSWNFIIIQSVILAFWIILNSVGWFYHWDSAPFILLNLCLSFQAAFTGPIVLLSQNRQAARDRLRDDTEAFEIQKLYENHDLLFDINKQQLELLHQQAEILTYLQGKDQPAKKRG